MINKIAAVASATALTLMMAVPALAGSRPDSHDNHFQMPNLNMADVRVENYSGANTGSNFQGSTVVVENDGMAHMPFMSMFDRKSSRSSDDILVCGDNDMTTGQASATAISHVEVNKMPACTKCNMGSTTMNFATVRSFNDAIANTGENTQGTYVGASNFHGDVKVYGDNTLRTGAANATAKSWTVVNSQYGGMPMPH